MSDRSLLAEYLRARRDLVQPEDVGLYREAGRRVSGLRREEVARLAGISSEYYLRLEQGRDHQPSDQVLGALARALQLDDDGRTHLMRLARPEFLPRERSPREPAEPGSEVLALMGQWSHTAAYVTDRNHDVVAANPLARAMAPGYFEPGVNLLTAVFTEAPREPDEVWRPTASTLIASLRYHGDPFSPRLQQIVGTLAVADREFRTMWSRHDAHPQISGVSPTYVDPVGWVHFRWQTLEIPGDTGYFLTVFYADPGTPAELANTLLRRRVEEQSQAARVSL
ncbi:helix-turn-helix transcriptional regulator [Herbiconiux liangxiaofengii]|uniref:helix-turn-helix transcriptional regulator n=1 Tax=Herbiconiux liangxiaofengii TaxID=3342795 RepID=UPI0035B76520